MEYFNIIFKCKNCRSEKKDDFMEFVKTEKGWLNLETEELTQLLAVMME